MSTKDPSDQVKSKSAETDKVAMEMDADAPTVFMQKAIDPSIFASRQVDDSDETRIIRTVNPKAARKMSEEELNRIVDEVGRFGAMPMDKLPSEVGNDLRKKNDDNEKR